jgi:urea transporter
LEIKAPPGWLILLKGSGQVMFCEHPISGALFLLGVAGGSLAAGQPAVIAGALLGLLVSTLAGVWLNADKATLGAGLCGYNGLLVGAALARALGADNSAIGNGFWGFNPVLTTLALGCVFRPAGARSLALAVFGAVVTTLVQGAMQHLTMPFKVPVLTMPFVLVTWLFLLANPNPESAP